MPFDGTELAIALVTVLVIFAAGRLWEAGRAVGRTVRELLGAFKDPGPHKPKNGSDSTTES